MNTSLPGTVAWHVGTCGIADGDWTGNFYPRGTNNIARLGFYATRFNSIELNTTFYAIPQAKLVRRWRNVTPAHFRFSVKMLKDITHHNIDRLTADNTLDTVKRFFDVVRELGEKLTTVLIQFPPEFSPRYRSMLYRFLDRISCPTRLTVEFRSDGWWTPEMESFLRGRQVGWTVSDLSRYPALARAPLTHEVGLKRLRKIKATTDFLYVRYLGEHHQFPNHFGEHVDSTPRVAWWHEQLASYLEMSPSIRNVYAFFDNDFSGHAPTAARRFANAIGLPRYWEPERGEPTLFGSGRI